MTREIRYALMDPSGNRTILVISSVPEHIQTVTAAKLMDLEPTAEQTGFLEYSESSGLSLRMAGGEFCGNAAMSAGIYHGIRTGLSKGKVILRVSGTPEPVVVDFSTQSEGAWKGTVEMPRPCSVETVRFPDDLMLPVVSFSGISHVILEQEISREEAEILAKRWCGFLNADALGLMFLNQKRDWLTPLVYVPAADTLFWESACGSGTSAVVAWIARQREKPVTVALQQPGGILKAAVSPDGSIFLTGMVRLLHEKTVIFDFQNGTII